MTELEHINVDTLPPQVRVLVKLIGLANTIELLKTYGGMLITMPTRAEKAVLLPNVIGHEAVARICNSRLAGRRIDLPKCDKIIIQLRNQAILAARGQATKRDLARHYGLTARTVQLIWNGAQDDNPTGDLFKEQP